MLRLALLALLLGSSLGVSANPVIDSVEKVTKPFEYPVKKILVKPIQKKIVDPLKQTWEEHHPAPKAPPVFKKNPEREMTRLEIARALIQKFHVPTDWVLTEVSPFADIQTSDAHYQTLEVAWNHQILQSNAHYEIRPDETMSQFELLLAIQALLLPGKKVQDPFNLVLLGNDDSFSALPEPEQQKIVTLYEHYILDLFNDLPIQRTPVTVRSFDTLMREIDDARALLSLDAQKGVTEIPLRLLPALPEGLAITLSPADSIIGKDLEEGQILYFTLQNNLQATENMTFVPDSILTGKIMDMEQNTENEEIKAVTVKLSSIRNAYSNVIWRLAGVFDFDIVTSSRQSINVIDGKNKGSHNVKNFILPSRQFQFTSMPVTH